MAKSKTKAKTRSVPITTSLSPTAFAVLCAFAMLEDPASGAANIVWTRQLREDAERIAPGLWAALSARGAELAAAGDMSPRGIAAELLEVASKGIAEAMARKAIQ